MLLHANFGPLKCVANIMQKAKGSCNTWKSLIASTGTGDNNCPRSRKGTFGAFARRFFADCCTDSPT